MGLIPPPRPLTKEEYEARIRAGAKTLQEIDPEFFKYLNEGRKARLWGLVFITLGIIVAIVVVATSNLWMSGIERGIL